MSSHNDKSKDEPLGFFENPRNIDRLIYGLWAICAILVLAEFSYSGHAHFSFAGWFGFYALFGFAAYCFVVFSAKGLRVFVARKEDYYGDDAPLETAEPEHQEHSDEH